MPSLNNEKRLWAQGLLRVVGVDEVGMAALAGPVVAAACMVTPDTKLIRKVNDSKVLTRLQREGLLDSIKGRVVKIGIGVERTFMVHSPRVDKIELVRHGHARRAALYFLRDRVGKAATLREKRR